MSIGPPDGYRDTHRCDCGHIAEHHEQHEGRHMHGCDCALSMRVVVADGKSRPHPLLEGPMSDSPTTWTVLLTTPLWLGAAFALEAVWQAADRLARTSRHGRGWEW